AKLAELNRELTKTVLVWGGKAQREADGKKNAAAFGLAPSSAAERVACQAKNGRAAAYCFLDCYKQNKVKLEEVKKEELPDPLKKLSLKEQKEYLAKLDQCRTELNKQVLELDRKRGDYVAKKQVEEGKKGKAGFDAKVLGVLRGQAKKYEITY